MSVETSVGLRGRSVYVRQRFDTSTDLRTATQQTFLSVQRSCKSAGGGGKQKFFVCVGRRLRGKEDIGCQARVRAYYSSREGCWHITEAHLKHDNCTGDQKGAALAAVSPLIATLVSANRDINATAIRNTIRAQTGIDVHTRSALRGKAQALQATASGHADGFRVLSSFLTELQASSSGTVTSVQWDDQGHFLRCFVMPGAAANVAANSPQEFFCLDSAHLRGDWGGVLLSITTLDANNKINLCAIALAPTECAEAYEYLLEQAMRNEHMKVFLNKATSTCFTDFQKGADKAVARVIPLTESRRCLEHTLRDVGPVGAVGVRHAYAAARQTSEEGFQRSMDLMGESAPTSRDELSALPHTTWAHYGGRKNACWNHVTTNTAECSNSILREVRKLPVFDLVHSTVLLIARRLCEAANLEKSNQQQRFTPYAIGFFDKEFTSSRSLGVSPLGCDSFYVTDPKESATRGQTATVTWGDLPRGPAMKCSCEVPLQMQLPCRHVLAAARAQGKTDSTLSLIHEGFVMEGYRMRACDPAYPLVLPVWDSLAKDATKKAPVGMESTDGSKRRRSTKRIPSVGESGIRGNKRRTT